MRLKMPLKLLAGFIILSIRSCLFNSPEADFVYNIHLITFNPDDTDQYVFPRTYKGLVCDNETILAMNDN